MSSKGLPQHLVLDAQFSAGVTIWEVPETVGGEAYIKKKKKGHQRVGSCIILSWPLPVERAAHCVLKWTTVIVNVSC